jgi:hypothetical protein
MLTSEMISRVQESRRLYGGNRGSCFGVLDQALLRGSPGSDGRPAISQPPRYRLMFRGRSVSKRLQAVTLKDALAEVKGVLGIKGRLTATKFYKAGGFAVLLGRETQFPCSKARTK